MLQSTHIDQNEVLQALTKLDNKANKVLAVDVVRALRSIMPTTEEIGALKVSGFSDLYIAITVLTLATHTLPQAYTGKLEEMQAADQFCYKLVQIEAVGARINGLLYEYEFDTLHNEAREQLMRFKKGIVAINKTKALLLLMAMIRETGNYLNYQSFNGGAVGFPLSSALKLGDVKAKDGSTLMNFMAGQFERHHHEALAELRVRQAPGEGGEAV